MQVSIEKKTETLREALVTISKFFGRYRSISEK